MSDTVGLLLCLRDTAVGWHLSDMAFWKKGKKAGHELDHGASRRSHKYFENS